MVHYAVSHDMFILEKPKFQAFLFIVTRYSESENLFFFFFFITTCIKRRHWISLFPFFFNFFIFIKSFFFHT